MKNSIRSAFLASSVLLFAAPAAAGTISYSYDQLGRLVQAVYPDGTTIQYTYDSYGNRTAYVVTGSPN